MTVKKEHAADHEPNESFDAPWLVGSGRYPDYTMPSTRNGVNMVRALSIQGGGEKKYGGKRIPFCGLTVTFLASVSGRNE